MDETSTRFEADRTFLKDTVRQTIDFRTTAQHRGLPAPPLQKLCPPDIPRVALPNGEEALRKHATMPTANAILQRESVRAYDPSPMTLEQLSALLWATQGVREVYSPECALRTVPSAGARHAFETYVTVDHVDGLDAGLYRYIPFDGELARMVLDRQIGGKAAQACLGQGFVAGATAVFFWTAVPERMEWRYDRAAHKVIAIDVGHVGQNLYLACTAMGLGTCAIAAYDQEACDRLLGVDGRDEFTVYISPVGRLRS